MVTALRSLPPRTWLRAVPYAVIAALFIGIPSDIIDTPIFGRPVELRSIDYVIWLISSALIGLTFAIRLPNRLREAEEKNDIRATWGGFASFLAVGCPVCNQFVVAALGTSGALTWWAPVQPIFGALAIGFVLWALRTRLHTYQLVACPAPKSPAKLSGDAQTPSIPVATQQIQLP